MTISFNGREVTQFQTDEPLIVYPNDLVFATLKINGEPFGIYVKKEDIERLKGIFKSEPINTIIQY